MPKPYKRNEIPTSFVQLTCTTPVHVVSYLDGIDGISDACHIKCKPIRIYIPVLCVSVQHDFVGILLNKEQKK